MTIAVGAGTKVTVNGPRPGKTTGRNRNSVVNNDSKTTNTGPRVTGTAPVVPPVSPASAIGFGAQMQSSVLGESQTLAALKAAIAAAKGQFKVTKAGIKSQEIQAIGATEQNALGRGVLGGSADLMGRAGIVAEATQQRLAAKNQLLTQLAQYKQQASSAKTQTLLDLQTIAGQKAAEQANTATQQFATGAMVADTAASGKGVDTSLNIPANATHMQQRVISLAQSQIGVPYSFGTENARGPAQGPGASFDCSGLTKWVAAKFGVDLPHNAAEQAATMPHVSRQDLQPGDFVYFGNPIHHVGIYIGGGQMIDAPHTGAVVRVEPLFSDFVFGGRIQRPTR